MSRLFAARWAHRAAEHNVRISDPQIASGGPRYFARPAMLGENSTQMLFCVGKRGRRSHV